MIVKTRHAAYTGLELGATFEPLRYKEKKKLLLCCQTALFLFLNRKCAGHCAYNDLFCWVRYEVLPNTVFCPCTKKLFNHYRS